MGAIQGMVNSAIGATTKVAGTVKGLDIAKNINKEIKSEKPAASGKDVKMAARARKQYRDKIDAIYANKEISNKARARRLSKVLDEYRGGGR